MFVAGLDPNEFHREGISLQIAPAGPLINYAIDCEHSEPRAPALPGWSRAEPFIGVLWVALSCTARFRRRLGLNASRRPHLLAPISGQTSSNQAILSSSRQRALVDYQHTVSREVRFNDRVHAFAGYWHFHPRACAPYRARTKGKDERGVGYVKRNAIAGHDFVNWPASEGDLDWWMREIAQRVHGTTGEVPLIRFQRDEAAALAALDGPAAVSPETRAGAAGAGRLRVAVDGNSYSIPWRLIGESVQVTVCGGQVRVSHAGQEVAVHAETAGRRQRIVDPTHFHGVAGVARPVGGIAAAASIPAPPALLRPLAEYERAAGGGWS